MTNRGETLLGEADCLVLTRKQTNKKIDFAAKPWQYMVGTHVRYEANTRWILPITEDAGSIVMVPRDPLTDSHVNSTSETLELVICNDQIMKDKRMNKQTIKWKVSPWVHIYSNTMTKQSRQVTFTGYLYSVPSVRDPGTVRLAGWTLTANGYQ